MASFKILALSPSSDSLDKACIPALTRWLDQNKSVYSVTAIADLPTAWADQRPLSSHPTAYQTLYQDIVGVDGVYLFLPVYGLAPTSRAKAMTEIVAGALWRKPLAFVVSQGSVRSHAAVRDFMANFAFEHQTFCYPLTVDITHADLDADRRPSSDLERRLAALVHEFTVFAATIKLFSKTTGQAPAIPTSRLDLPRVNHLNVLTQDLRRSLKFYAETLGVRYLYNLGPKKAVTELDGFEFFIEEVAEVHYPPGFHFGVRTTQQGVFA